MDLIRFEAADTAEWTAIGEGLTRVARDADRLLVRPRGEDGPKYALRHDDGCGVHGTPIAPGEVFYLDPGTGEVVCEAEGRRRRGAE